MPDLPAPLQETARFRAGSAFELVLFDHLRDDERAMFGELADDPELYGVLRPTRPGHSYRTAGRDLALLLLTLAEPTALPRFARAAHADDLAALVLDGVLEVEQEGGFVSGAAATPLFAIAGAGEEIGASHPLARLAGEALLLAATLGGEDPARLAAFLYDFNRCPADPPWSRRLAGREEVLAFLGFEADSPSRRRLEAAFEPAPANETNPGWISFSRRAGRSERRRDVAYKLYVSPRIEALPNAFRVLADVLASGRRGDFKVGADAAGLLRPDKLVAYFAALDDLLSVARQLEERLAGTPAQGVPFTAPIDAAGLLSWGVDPPASARPLSWHEQESWRTWLAGRLGTLLARGADALPTERRDFALSRLAREGVDVERWTPSAGAFRAA